MFRRLAARPLTQKRWNSAPSTEACVVHLAGPHKNGTLEMLTDVLVKGGGDILASRATVLGSELSVMVVYKCAAEKAENLRKSITEGPWEDAEVCIHPSTSPDINYVVPYKHSIKVLRITGHDRNGIVALVTKYLSSRGVRVLNFASEMAAAPFTDDPMFKMRIICDLPPEVSAASIDGGIEEVANELGVDIWVESLE
eukprot:TRINITY_DN2035_c0_g1_i4.p1 TRINITY_DN2035_c0_g1~~TRINITY_DN2035_c0_g1_i4.p1  ORF type:complete len:213 (+),score=52.75 TRINITY_DN2035_c0_g1_i4:46-639(+)